MEIGGELGPPLPLWKGSQKEGMLDGSETTFPVVCLGASAGGLQSYIRLFHELPVDVGLAVVVINHMRHSRSLIAELLARCTPMPVQVISERMPLRLNHVYVIPPNCDLTLLDSAFHLSPLSKPWGWPNVITIFLESLAREWKGQAVAVILSGMGSDGVAALRVIKEAGGITFAQKIETAEYPEMPRSAIDSGFVDFVLSPESIAHELTRIAHVGG